MEDLGGRWTPAAASHLPVEVGNVEHGETLEKKERDGC
jgi:hypothetical protein